MNREARYDWEESVYDALVASPDLLPLKINVAERAIAARLNNPQLGKNERIALKDALNLLHVLLTDSRAFGTSKYRTNGTSSRGTLKYAWQEAVFEAFVELRPAHLAQKVNAAQRAISERLRDPALTDLDERIALREALLSLRELMPKCAKPKGESEQIA